MSFWELINLGIYNQKVVHHKSLLRTLILCSAKTCDLPPSVNSTARLLCARAGQGLDSHGSRQGWLAVSAEDIYCASPGHPAHWEHPSCACFISFLWSPTSPVLQWEFTVPASFTARTQSWPWSQQAEAPRPDLRLKESALKKEGLLAGGSREDGRVTWHPFECLFCVLWFTTMTLNCYNEATALACFFNCFYSINLCYL